MNIYDVSKKAGVSIATVSRVLNGNSKVSEATRAKVLTVIEECGYTPNAFARGLGLNTMQTVGIMCADSSDPYLASAIYYLERLLRKEGYDALLCCTGYEVSEKQKYLELLLSKRVDSVILVGSNFVEAIEKNNAYIKQAAKQVPVMLLNAAMDGSNIYSTLCDDFQAMYEATITLFKSGCNKILYLYNSNSYSGKKKLKGFKAAHEDAGIEVDSNCVQYFNGHINEVASFLCSLRQSGTTFDAIITSDDSLAVGALKYARLENQSVPDQLSIIGYNNSIIAECCNPEMTSIDNKLELVCQTIVTSLMGILNGQSVPLRTVFSAEIKKRETTKF